MAAQTCGNETEMFQACLKQSGGDVAPCQAYMDMMTRCKARLCPPEKILSMCQWQPVVLSKCMLMICLKGFFVIGLTYVCECARAEFPGA